MKSKQGPALIFNYNYLNKRKNSKKYLLNILKYQEMVVMENGSNGGNGKRVLYGIIRAWNGSKIGMDQNIK